ncbi:hypothetical protein HLB23_00860 [Nocardia uniformis]|uniref:NfeD-like C-terminal domain-containing protein n=1 Tax=Nocardia uniformis TaxID=53432 RepID=A0A849BUA9_9NOCA|nr:hypothetical protein [Nocardia uniformis]NNH68446.1 hypothetical protein [Nocardia uniformis]
MTDPVHGKIGTVQSPIGGAGQLGEILVSVRGGRELYIARASEPIGVGATVLVVHVNPGRIVDVVPWMDVPSEPPADA